MTTLFIDVSLHDRKRRGGPLDWAAIAAAGYGLATTGPRSDMTEIPWPPPA